MITSMNDLKKMGTQIIIRSGSRLRWWISKLLWLVTYAVVYTGICMLVVALYTLANDASLNLHLTMSVAMVFTKKSFLLCSLLRLLCIAVVQPVLLLVLLGTIQMALSMKISGISAFSHPVCGYGGLQQRHKGKPCAFRKLGNAVWHVTQAAKQGLDPKLRA